MTTTTPSPLAAQIAQEHWLNLDDECGTCGPGDYALCGPRNYALHIATVTEQAVRDLVAQEIEAARTQADEFIQGDRRRRAKSRGHATFNAGMTRAARIARGGTP